MVGVTIAASKDKSSSAHNPMIKYLLKVREDNARPPNYKKDYSHVFRKKTRLDLIRLSAIAMGIELSYAAETAFVSPILLQIGIDHKLMTMAWAISPMIGFFVAPLLGSVSDRCTLNWGRRRPLISILSAGIFIGLLLVPHGRDLGALLGDIGYNYTASNQTMDGAAIDSNAAPPEESNFKFAAALTILGMVLLDFNADTCQTPARTYLLDVCTAEDQPRALTTFTLMAGLGGTIGYAIGGINWEDLSIGNFMGGNVPTVFGMVTIIFIICYFVTITTFREIPLKLMEKDDLLKPLSAAAIKTEVIRNHSVAYYIKETLTLEQPSSNGVDNPVMESYQNSLSLEQRKSIEPRRISGVVATDDLTDGPSSVLQYLKSIFVMPYSMRMLALTNLFCWMGHVTYCLYFTDFVGEAVFGGDPMAAPDSETAELYEAGVRFGCFGMSIYAFSCSVYSMVVTKLMKMVGIKVVYISGILYYGIGMAILGVWPTKWGVLFFSTSAGILYGTLFTIPYILVANYHAKNCFRIHNGETVALKQNRGLGTDVAIISSMVFMAQLMVSLSMGPLISWLNTTCAILYASTFLAFCAAISAMFVLYI